MKELIIILLAFQFGWSFGIVFEKQIKQFIQFNKDCFKINDDEDLSL